ncbi:MAG TPA: NAD(P)-dependent oxidoreductase [Mycobacteriales bacterium]|nr:NAD(P)-dependent oxidoreductase [Mycobacteriales bacterium]
MPAVTPPWRLLALAPLDLELWKALFADVPVEVAVPAPRTQQAVGPALADAEIVVGDWTGTLRLTAAEVAGAPRLAFVQQPSVGVDTLDVDALAGAGVPAANAAGANAVSVAEWCVGASYAVLRWLSWADAQVRAGEWPQLDIARRGGGELAGRRVGIIGMGRIGVECAQRFVALGSDVAHWSRTERAAADAGGARWLPLDDLLVHSQLLVVVIALTAETSGLLSAERLARLPEGSYVVNAARGGVLDEDALLAAVRSGRLAGAALDVYASEPLPADSPLRGEDRILLSPHAGGATREAQGRLISAVVDNVRRAVSGEPVEHVVNGVDPRVRRRT